MDNLKRFTFKKISCIALAVATILTFTACNREPSNNSSESSSSSKPSSSQSASSSSSSDSSSDVSSSSSGDSSASSTISSSSQGSSSAVEPKTTQEKLDAAIKTNSDVVGWLKVPNTQIDNEILQSKDNEYYLRRDISKNYNWYGCYYADHENVIKTAKDLTLNTVIYGHNMEDRPNGKKFAQLFNYLNLDFAKNNPYIYVTTPQEELVFQVYAVYYTETGFSYNVVNQKQEIDHETTMSQIIKEGKLRSELNYDVDVNTNDKLLTLSTCTYKFGGEKNEEQRFVVQARLLRDNEQVKSTVSVSKNPSPKAPTFSKEY